MSKNIMPDNAQQSIDELQTKIIKLEAELEEKESLIKDLAQKSSAYQTLLNTTHEVVFVHEFPTPKSPGFILDCNDYAIELLGYSKAELLSKTPFDLIVGGESTFDPSELEKANLLQDNSKRSYLIAKDGRQIPVEIKARLFEINNQPMIIAVGRDITESLKHEIRMARAQEIANIGYWGTKGDNTYWSDNYYLLMGYEPNEVKPSKELFIKHIHPVDRERIEREIKNAVKIKKNIISEFRYITKSGKEKWGQSQAEFVLDEHGNIQYIEGVFHDITEQKESERRFKFFFDHATDAIFLTDFDCKVVDVNKQACRKLGYSRVELLGMSMNQIDIRLGSNEQCCKYIQQLKAESTILVEGEHRCKDGSFISVQINAGLVNFQGNQLVLGIARDVTELKKAENALKESETMFRELFDNIDNGVSILEKDDNSNEFILVDMNKAGLSIVGIKKKDIIGKSISKVFSDVRLKELLEVYVKVWKTGKSSNFPFKIFDNNKLKKWVETFIFKLPTGQIVTIFEDKSQKHLAELEIKASEERYRVLANATLEAVLLTDNGKLVDINEAAGKMFGYDYTEMIGMMGDDLIAPESKSIVRHRVLAAFDTPYEAVALKKDGTKFPVLIHTRIFNYKGKQIRLSTCLDLSEQKQYEQEIKENQTRLERAEEIAKFGNWEFHFKTNTVIASKGAQSIYGYIDYSILESIQDTQNIVLPQYRPFLDDALKDLVEYGKSYDVEFKIKRPIDGIIRDIHSIAEYDKNNQVVFGVIHDVTAQKRAEAALKESEAKFRALFDHAPIGIGISSLERQGSLSETNEAMQKFLGYSGEEILKVSNKEITFPDDYDREMLLFKEVSEGKQETYHLEKRYISKDNQILWGSLNVAMIRDDENKPFFLLAMIEDITRRKNAEEEIRRSLEEKKVLLKEIHHRVKNNMQIISSLLTMQATKFKEPVVQRACETSRLRIYAMALVHEKLYQSDDFARIDFKEYLDFLAQNLITTMNPDKEIKYVLDIDEMSLSLDVAIPCGLIINEVITNAIKHAFVDCDQGTISISSHIDDGKLTLAISDDGIGLPNHLDIDSTESLGMQLIQGLARQIDGNLNIVRNDRGTSFKICFEIS